MGDPVKILKSHLVKGGAQKNLGQFCVIVDVSFCANFSASKLQIVIGR